MKHFFSLMRGGLLATLVLLVWLTGPVARAQTPDWQMANIMTSPTLLGNLSYSMVRATAADANGNIYLVGEYFFEAYFGSIRIANSLGPNLFVAKWNATTNSFSWVQQVTGVSGTLTAAAVAVSGNNIYVAGTSSSTTSFGSIVMPGSGGTDAFVTKLVDAGTTASFAWVQQSTGTGDEKATGLALSGPNIYLTGTFGGSGVAGTAVFGGTTFTAAGVNTTDIFVTKLTDAGSTAAFSWALQVGGINSDLSRAVAANGTTIYLGGYATGPVAFGSTTTTTSSNTQAGFVAKLVDAGATATFTWVQVPAGQTDIFALAVNGSAIYAAGEFAYSALFGSLQLTSAGGLDGFVVKLVDAGTTSRFVWTHRFGYNNYDGAHALAVRGQALFVAGYLFTEMYLGRLTDLGTTCLAGWTQSPFGSTAPDYAEAVTVAPNGSVYIAGRVIPPVDFPPFYFNNARNQYCGFLASLTDPTLLATTAAQSNLSFTLFPNPARRATTVQLPALPGTTTATLILRDALGRAVRAATAVLPAAGMRHELDLSGLPAGIYALQVQAGPATATRRLVVE